VDATLRSLFLWRLHRACQLRRPARQRSRRAVVAGRRSDQSQERYSRYALKLYALPELYWNGMLRGRM